MQFDFTVPSGGGRTIDVQGQFFRYRSGLGAIRITTSRGASVDLLPGQGVFGVDFTSLNVKDISGADNAGVILAGAYDFRDDRIAGTVDVVDGGRIRTMQGQAMMAGGGWGQTASTYAVWQIWNPVGSGRRIAIGSYSMTASAAGGVSIMTSAAAATLIGVGASKLIPVAGTVTGGIAQLRGENRASPDPAVGERVLDQANVQANVTFSRALKEPIVLMPGAGIHMLMGVTSISINGTWEWTEELI